VVQEHPTLLEVWRTAVPASFRQRETRFLRLPLGAAGLFSRLRGDEHEWPVYLVPNGCCIEELLQTITAHGVTQHGMSQNDRPDRSSRRLLVWCPSIEQRPCRATHAMKHLLQHDQGSRLRARLGTTRHENHLSDRTTVLGSYLPGSSVLAKRRGSAVTRSVNTSLILRLPDRKIGIELDGFATHSSTADIAKDRQRQRAIEAEGWRIISRRACRHERAACMRQCRRTDESASPSASIARCRCRSLASQQCWSGVRSRPLDADLAGQAAQNQ